MAGRDKLDYTIIELLENTARNIKAHPVNLGGISGTGGGEGGPPGGFIGYLPQTRVAYDTDEAAYSGILSASSGTLLDNLAHIRYRLDALEVSSGTLTVEEQDGSPSVTNVDKIIFSGALVTDLGGGDVLVSISGVAGSGGGFTEAQLNTMYLRLDTANDPIVAELKIDVPYVLGYEDFIFLTRIQGNTRHILGGNGAITTFRYGDGNTGEMSIPPPAIYINDTDVGIPYSGGTILHADYITGDFRVNINPYVPPAGTLVLFDSVNAITQSGRLISLENQGDEKFYITGSGVWGTENNIVATVPTPSTGYTNVYVDSITKKLASKDDAGSVVNYAVKESLGGRLWVPFGVYLDLTPMAPGTKFPYSVSFDTAVTFVKWSQSFNVLGTNNGSHYWTINIKLHTSGTLIASFNTSAYSGSTWSTNTLTSFSVSSIATPQSTGDIGMYVECVSTGTPGNLYIYGPMLLVQV